MRFRQFLTDGFSRDFSAKPPKSAGKGPQWTVAELARKFDLTVPQLVGLRQKYPGFPEPSAKHTVAGTKTYYDLKDALKWFASVRKSVSGDIENLKKEIESHSGRD